MKKTSFSGVSPAHPDRLRTYFEQEKIPLFVVSVTGILYNVGMVAGPWFEGQLAQLLCDVIGGGRTAADMARLAAAYVAVILLVQAMRYAKRFYVRRFANDVSRSMKQVLYRNLVHCSTAELQAQSIGAVMTKAVSDVDTCAEGMRKFTTEVFDTGVVMVAYVGLLMAYDVRLTLISCLFPPVAYWIAGRLKKTVSRCAAVCKESAGRLSGETLDRIGNAMTYRVLGAEQRRDESYEARLADYEQKAVRAGLLETALQPLYQIISMGSVVFIIGFGIRNVQGTGWVGWNIAAFTTFLSCFTKLAVKSSKAAKLFNAVQKAQVSWQRIRPMLRAVPADQPVKAAAPAAIAVDELTFCGEDGRRILDGITFHAQPGQIIGLTGAVACGKSTLGRMFLAETPYDGSIRIGGRELAAMRPEERAGAVAYLGHDPELRSATIRENICMGEPVDAEAALRLVCMDEEVRAMENGLDTVVGSGGIRLSGGQQARIALARTVSRKRALIVLDDPFSAVDSATERQIMQNLRAAASDCVLLLISHRLTHFSELDQVLWMENGRVLASTHAELMHTKPDYRAMVNAQIGGEPQ